MPSVSRRIDVNCFRKKKNITVRIGEIKLKVYAFVEFPKNEYYKVFFISNNET